MTAEETEKSKMEEKYSSTTIDWKKTLIHFSLLSGVDMSIQVGYVTLWADKDKSVDTQVSVENPETKDISFPYAATSRHLLYSAVARSVFLLLTFLVSHKKVIPKIIQSFVGYIIGGIIYAFCVHLTFRFLLDSELDNGVFNVPYLFLIVFNFSINVAAFFLARKAVFESGAIEKESCKEKDGKEDDEKSDRDDGEDEDEDDMWDYDQINAERKIPIYKMVPKIASWYKHQLGWIVLGYSCLIIIVSSKLSLYHRCYCVNFFY